MGNNTKPWLNHKSEISEKKHSFAQKTARSYRMALFYLLVGGIAGAHKFYLYDTKTAWKIFGGYLAILGITASMTANAERIRILALICYWAAIVLVSLGSLKLKVEAVNIEIQKND